MERDHQVIRIVMTDRLRGWLLVGAQFALLAALAFAPRGDLWSIPHGVAVGGAVVRGTGAALIVVAALRLGFAASVHPAPTTSAVLRTDGPYRFVRHPIYTGVLAFGAAMALSGASLVHLLSWVALLAVLQVKAGFEEGLLAARFPEYEAYAARTRRFVPLPRR